MPASRPAHALGVRGSCVLLLAIRFRYCSGALSFCDRSPLTRMTGHGRWRPTHPGNRSKRETTPLIRRDLPEWRLLSRSGCPDTINTPTCRNGSQLTRAALIHVLRRLLTLPTVHATRYVVLRCSSLFSVCVSTDRVCVGSGLRTKLVLTTSSIRQQLAANKQPPQSL